MAQPTQRKKGHLVILLPSATFMTSEQTTTCAQCPIHMWLGSQRYIEQGTIGEIALQFSCRHHINIFKKTN